ncbi:hypothetical protein [Phenylobacterium soli]|uniref:Uncharacterized protein n=1 Tax=Phenylobacterium soli TaxID=2170551 RepID=A0A328AN64_9CAUL|nr:hypothetical protein [Phenylobacterium soli]RAK54874.1 hypothetical protein DJ017_10225 [Phenylobacterium soli]
MQRSYAFHLFDQGGEHRGVVSTPLASDVEARRTAHRLLEESTLRRVAVVCDGVTVFTLQRS